MEWNEFYLVNVFTGEGARGNQCCVILWEDLSDEEGMRRFAADMNLPATTFLCPSEHGFDVRWFAPMAEIDLCGHGSVAAGWVWCLHLKQSLDIQLNYEGGKLHTGAEEGVVYLSGEEIPMKQQPIPDHVKDGFHGKCTEYFTSGNKNVAVMHSAEDVENMKPDWEALRRSKDFGYVITAPGRDSDCVSRVILPYVSFKEDQATGSAHILIAPYWAKRLEKPVIHAFQASARGGAMRCTVANGEVRLDAVCEIYAHGHRLKAP